MNNTIAKIIGVQALATVIVALLCAVLIGPQAAYSALLGGAIGFVPAFVYAVRIQLAAGGPPQKVLRANYSAEALKLAVTLLLFAATFKWLKDVSVVPLFAAYFVTLAVYWGALFFA